MLTTTGVDLDRHGGAELEQLALGVGRQPADVDLAVQDPRPRLHGRRTSAWRSERLMPDRCWAAKRDSHLPSEEKK